MQVTVQTEPATLPATMPRRHSAGERTRARILAAMLSIGEPASLRQIGALAGRNFMTVKHHADILTEDGLVERLPDGLSLTTAGRAAAKLVPRGA